MSINYTGLAVYAYQCADLNLVADYYGIPVSAVIEKEDLSSWNPGGHTGSAYKQILLTTLFNMPHVRVVVGKGAKLQKGEASALKEIHQAQPESRKIVSEETVQISMKMKEFLKFCELTNGSETAQHIFSELGYRVEADEDDKDTFIVKVPFGASFTFKWVSDDEIYMNTAQLRSTVIVNLAEDQWGIAPQLIAGLKGPKEFMEIMLAVLTMHAETKAAQYAVGALLGFTGALGPDARERDELDEDGLLIKTKYSVGVVGLFMDRGGKVHAGRGSLSGNRPNVVEICRYMDALDATAWYIPDNRGSFPLRIPYTDLATDGGPLGIKLVGTEIEFAGSNIKGLLKSSAASHCGSMTVPCVIDAVSPISQCGQAHIGAEILDEAVGKRLVTIGGSHRYSAADHEMAFMEAKNSHILVAVGDLITFSTDADGNTIAHLADERANGALVEVAKAKPEDNVKVPVLDFNGNIINWSSDDGAVEGRVIEVVKNMRLHGASKNVAGEYEFVLTVTIEATDKGAAKGRGPVKAMMQTNEAAGVQVLINGQVFKGLHIGDGLIKSSKQLRKRFKETGRGRVEVSSVYNPIVYATTKEIYDKPEYAAKFTFDDATCTITTVDDNAILGEVTFLIESSSVQENVGSAAMTLYQILFLGFTKAGKDLLKQYVVPDMVRRTHLLGYLAGLGSFPNAAKIATGEQFLYLLLGTNLLLQRDDVLDLHGEYTPAMTDVQLLEKVKELYPQGVNIIVNGVLAAAIDADKVLQATAPDGLGSGLTGLGETVARLVRVMADPALRLKLVTANPDSVAGLVQSVKIDAAKLAKSGGFGRVYGTRWGVTSKMVASRGIGMEEIHIHPDSRIAKRLARKFKCNVADLNGKAVYVLRHPVIVGYVATIVLNDKVNLHVMMANEMKWRRVNQGDFDGDTGCIFPITNIGTRDIAAELRVELEALLPKGDMNLATYGPGNDAEHIETLKEVLSDGTRVYEPLMFSEAVSPNNTADKMIAKSKKMTADKWFETIREGVEANTWWTGTAYRLMEGGSIQYALGLTNPRMMMLGAWLYEHKGLAGKPVGESCKKFMQSWIWPLWDTDVVTGMMSNLRVTMNEVKCYKSSGDILLPHAIKVGNHLNRSIKHGAPDEATVQAPVYDKYGQEMPYHMLTPLFRVAWMLGRKKLSQAVADCVIVASDEMEQSARVHGFDDSFLYNLCRLVSKQLGTVNTLIGDLMDTEAQEDDDVSWGEDEW